MDLETAQIINELTKKVNLLDRTINMAIETINKQTEILEVLVGSSKDARPPALGFRAMEKMLS